MNIEEKVCEMENHAFTLEILFTIAEVSREMNHYLAISESLSLLTRNKVGSSINVL